ncbi:hypothetical protein FN846DRAFT_961864 [Sphaerosporella brunnea]|uniref:T6SS Phospholipase effector Tle1-like catalytic domain-containing protein n=1 Tax=Sphaerosporella brunnea TaxID=1250544 RepID=A0A5J5EP56_9PEZI|nr:hypothetical protein FN846DRAFT_961864 [Sphaerosporella brunnea]
MSTPSSSQGATGGKRDREGNGDKIPNRLVLCFDGTGNQFWGTPLDTNIVKLYQMCDRGSKKQYHYYQPGIGTYSVSESSLNTGFLGSIYRGILRLLDEGFANTFDHHVIAGYKFLMRYYKPGDKIYIFGFSRGAFTARFLARMITKIGLLSRGNEEMVPFAYRAYQDYESQASGDEAVEFMETFRDTFCRQKVGIHFLGLFDCVNSVAALEVPWPFLRKQPRLHAHPPAATHIRHAVSIDERRLKFKPALFCQDDDNATDHSNSNTQTNIREVYFAGNHGDVGGGWAATADGGIQLSDIALEWMLQELEDLPDPQEEKLAFESDRKKAFLEKFKQHRATAIKDSICHDALAWNKGWGWPSVMGWWVFELIPIFKRLELEGDKWVDTYWPPNRGQPRDIPACSELHSSVRERATVLGSKYRPQNSGLPKDLTLTGSDD